MFGAGVASLVATLSSGVFCEWPMADQATLTHSAHVLAAMSDNQRADVALRSYFEHHRHLQPPARRAISRALFAYFRWLAWLDPKASPHKRIAHATTLQERFASNEGALKVETLAARAVPSWV